MHGPSRFVASFEPTPAHATIWASDLQTLLDRLGRHFVRSASRAHLRAYLTGLLSGHFQKHQLG